ncbi:unnamed protein product [Lasius platythorax]|uniref:Uncharacterized protein n=1 Tax=Lasius platythorax TaxID=488582 RepID=A0AAV2P8X1_9HYME
MRYSASGEFRDLAATVGSASNGRGMMQESRQESIMVRWSRLADKRTTIPSPCSSAGSRVNLGNFSVMVARLNGISIRPDFSRQTNRDG